MSNLNREHQSPLSDMDEWEDFLQARYADGKSKEDYRNYVDNGSVSNFYRLNHRYQSYDFVQKKKREFLKLNRRKMGIWEAIDFLNTLVDESDPDTDLSQLEHLLQTSEAIRADGHPDWFVLTGLIHDLGKILCLFGEPQWAVVGDTFPVGCAFSEEIVYPEFFENNPDKRDERYQSRLGIYSPGCGLDNVLLSWGHDEYLYHVVKDYLPAPALYMIRYHSFYAWHRHGAYTFLMNETDRQMLKWVQKFNPYDLYSKTPERPDVESLLLYYEKLVAKYFPAELSW